MSKNNNTVVSGTEIKINVHVDPLDKLHMSDYTFECKFFVFQKKSITITKDQMVKLDADNYLALVDTTTLGIGNLHMTLTAQIPDYDFEGTTRKEIVCVPTNINIVNC